jgi:anti-sigma factor RsiW
MSDSSLSHPNPQRLQAFALGQLDAAESAVVEEHVSTCDLCPPVLEAADDDHLVALVRSAGSFARTTHEAGKDNRLSSEQREQLLERFRAIEKEAAARAGECDKSPSDPRTP